MWSEDATAAVHKSTEDPMFDGKPTSVEIDERDMEQQQQQQQQQRGNWKLLIFARCQDQATKKWCYGRFARL